MKSVMLAAILLGPMALATSGQSQVQRLEVDSRWGGLGEPQSSHLVISQENGRYYAGSRQLPSSDVESFAAEVQHFKDLRSGLDALGISREWLNQSAKEALRGYLSKYSYKEIFTAQRELFAKEFPTYTLDFNSSCSDTMGTAIDDGPEVKIQLALTNGDQYALSSTDAPGFMDVWSITGPHSSCNTLNGAISRSLWRLLPPKFTNRGRFSDWAIRKLVADQIMSKIGEQWDRSRVAGTLGPATGPIPDRFTLLQSNVALTSSIDLDGEKTWNAVARDSTMASNVTISFSLPIRKGKPVGANILVHRATEYVQLAVSPKWLNEFLSAHPKFSLEVRFVEDRSLSPKALKTLAEDLEKVGKKDLALQISAAPEKVAFVELEGSNWSRWIVMPNGDVVLWMFEGQDVANWTAKDFTTIDCYGWRCAGAVISPDGQIRKDQ
jgi:hypothetical protein